MKKYKVLTLGASGAGKTVFLASLFKELSTQGKYGFYLGVPESNQQKKLNQIYTEIITKDAWPRGTRYSEVSEWTFTCCVKTSELMSYEACQFTYYDYCGGRLTDHDEDVEFEILVKQADSLLCLLDGQKIYGLLKNTDEFAINTSIFLKRDLPNLLKYIKNSDLPVHFIISKWDILEKEFSFKEVRDRLLEIPEFSEVIQQRNNLGSPIRLIPVSSVGSKFTRLQADGSMKKLPGAIPKPFQAEVPLACIFPDGFKARLNQLKREQQIKKEQKNLFLVNFWTIFDKFVPFIDLCYPVVLPLLPLLPPPYQLAIPVLERIVFGVNEIGKKASEKFWEEQTKSFQNVKDEETALKHAIDSFFYIQSKLIQDFPDSELILINSYA